MNAIVIDDATKSRINDVIQYAQLHKYSVESLKEILLKHVNIPGDNLSFVCHIPIDYKVVYTIDEGLSGDYYHHLSISVNKKDKLPNIEAVVFIANEFGLNLKNITDCDHVYIEKDEFNVPRIVNIMKLLET